MGNIAKQCRPGLFQGSDFAGDLEDSKSTSGGTLFVLGSHTFVSISWMCKKQTSVSHSSTESEIIPLDAVLRLDGIPALDLWDLIVAVLGNTNQNRVEQGDLLKNKREICSPPHTIHKRKQSKRVINDLDNADVVPSNANSSHEEAVFHRTSTPHGSETKRHCGKNSKKNRRRNIRCVITIRLGREVVV